MRPNKAVLSAGKTLKWLYGQPHLDYCRVVRRRHEGIMPRLGRRI
ncbi:hypothetical protein [Rhizobium sp. WL3]|nr:hypothetical protein [Rhizobium sp. WL3]